MAKFFPCEFYVKEDSWVDLTDALRFGETKGIFAESELHRTGALAGLRAPTMYPMGSILNIKGPEVVFICFGSFDEDQVKRMERSRSRFLWSLWQLPVKGKLEAPWDYADPAEVLPKGFLDNTAKVSRVIRWAPQVAILAHSAIGGFLSHCEWDSTLESIWFNVPIITWPQIREEQFNAYELMAKLGLATEPSK
ncbi:hypothetical protein EUGRSUZ_A00917 [Eucalyptus grandis]|uniref:UDP-glycosyltransferases domain-containing protein n=2 Tax=Eucalyptus grandis TaxID=71139 RepID=A0A059DE94_EUCGR|nr:hypothetical protein EUGRSUZ_A00917 [Eucalyptus grandis]